MMSAPEIKGWCPGALRPMESGDGWLVRIRPPLGTLTPAQAAGIARASRSHGNGTLDLTSRANLQLRGVRPAAHPALIDDLSTLGLIDPDIETESLRNLIVTPFGDRCPPSPSLPHKGGREALSGQTGDTGQIAATLTAALARMPRLPQKFGFAIDTGPHPVLTATPADIRVERAADGRLILRPDGHPFGKPIAEFAADALAMAAWFIAAGGMTDGRGRMAALVARGVVPDGCNTAPATPLPQPVPGTRAEGTLVAFAFGQIQAETLAALAALGHTLRVTPWRMLLIEGLHATPDIPGLITQPDDPLLRVTACTGAPGCPQALGPTRDLARALAPHVTRHLHVSGCTKGCAHPGPATTTLVATPHGYDLIRHGSAADTPHVTGLPPHLIAATLKDPHAPRL